MGTIKRTIYLNPIEPGNFSVRLPAGMQSDIEVTFYDASGATLTVDLMAQLQLTGRSTNRTISYAMPATDIANGKARVTIPEGALEDMNGYRLRVFGTVNGEAAMLALGVLRMIEAAGVQAYPDDIIDTVALTFTRGQPVDLSIALWGDETKSAPFPISEANLSAALYASQTATAPIMTFTLTVVTANSVTLSLLIAQVDSLPDSCWWKLVSTTGGNFTTLAEGPVTIEAAVP